MVKILTRSNFPVKPRHQSESRPKSNIFWLRMFPYQLWKTCITGGKSNKDPTSIVYECTGEKIEHLEDEHASSHRTIWLVPCLSG